MTDILLHIGYRKAATTYMKDWFYFHPELRFNFGTFGGFSNTSDICKFNAIDEKIKYLVLSDSFTQYYGDSPEKSKKNIRKFQTDTCLLLKKLFPAAKILIITRAAETAMLSEYSEYVKLGGVFNQEELIHKNETIEYFDGFLDYDFLINMYCNTFGKDNLIILPYELLNDDPGLFINTLEENLGLNHYDYTYQKRNPSLPDKKLWAFQKISRFVYQITGLFGTKGANTFKKYQKRLEKKSYENNKFVFLIFLITLFSKAPPHKKVITEEFLIQFKRNASFVNDYPLFDPYISKYFATDHNFISTLK